MMVLLGRLGDQNIVLIAPTMIYARYLLDTLMSMTMTMPMPLFLIFTMTSMFKQRVRVEHHAVDNQNEAVSSEDQHKG